METMARDRARLIADIEAFEPFNEQESVDKQVILRALKSDPNCFERSAQAHMATSIWTVDASFERTLLEWHNIYQSWSWIGGHADGVADLRAVALRELEEETGVHGRILPYGCGIPVEGELARGDGVLEGSIFRLNKTRRAKTVSRRVLNLSHEPISALTVAMFFRSRCSR